MLNSKGSNHKWLQSRTGQPGNYVSAQPEAARPTVTAASAPPAALIYQANGSNAKPMAPTCAESSEACGHLRPAPGLCHLTARAREDCKATLAPPRPSPSPDVVGLAPDTGEQHARSQGA